MKKVMERYRIYQKDLRLTFIDLEKTCDWGLALW